MRVISLNVWGGRVFDALLPYLQGSDADVFCLQEVTHTPLSTQDWLVYRDGGHELPQRANLFTEICKALPGHHAFFCAAAQGPLYSGTQAVLSQWGVATFVRRNLPVIGQTQAFVHGRFLHDDWGDHPRARNAHAVRIYDEESGSAVVVAHMHGLRDPSGKRDTPARVTQAQAFARLIESASEKDDMLVACGDFNVLPGSATFIALRKLSLVDLVTTRGLGGTRTSLYKKPGRFADYMLVGANVAVERFDVVSTPEVSDHRPLLLEIRRHD